jgi:hypothetical protein
MPTRLHTFSFSAALISFAVSPLAQAKTVLIGSNSADGFTIGMTKKQLERTRKDVTFGEDLGEGCLMGEVKNKPLTLMIENNALARIYFNDPSYVTSKGLHFGSTEKSVKAAYGKALKIETHHYDDAGHYLTLPAAAKGIFMRFETDGKLVNNFSIGNKQAIEYVEGCL